MRALLAAVLTSRLVPGFEPLPRDVWAALFAALPDDAEPGSVAETAREILDSESAEAVRLRLDGIPAFEAALSALEGEGVFALHDRDPRYPALWRRRLGSSSPALVFAAGNLDLPNARCIAVVGSRKASQQSLEFSRALGEVCASEGLALASGGARGVDKAAMRGAWQEGGDSIGVLADSMLQRVRDPQTSEAIDSDRVALVCPFSPSAPFSVGNAMGRNKLIYAMAEAAAVVSCAFGKGGTWAGAVEALRARWVPVGVWIEGQEPSAMRALEEKGALRLNTAYEVLSLASRPAESLFPEVG